MSGRNSFLRGIRSRAFRRPSRCAMSDWYPIGMELIFEIRDADEGGYCARALGAPIFTEADTWEELRKNVLEAVSLHFEESNVRPRMVQLHYVKDELIPLEAA